MGIKRNVMALLGMILLAAIAVVLILFLGSYVPALIIMPFLYLLAFWGFMSTYAAYPVIQKYMIDPVATPAPAEPEAES